MEGVFDEIKDRLSMPEVVRFYGEYALYTFMHNEEEFVIGAKAITD